MIVSHRHKFIFIHLGRTSGRSITYSLAQHCGPEDIITGVNSNRPGDFCIPGQNCRGILRHATAVQIRKYVGEKVWNEYFKFTMERNPWDKILSRYWAYAGRDGRFYKRIYTMITGKKLGFPEWFRMRVAMGYLVGLGHIRFPRHFHCYTQDGRPCIDFIGRHENRREHLLEISRRIGVTIDPDLRIGSQTRQDRAPYHEQFDPWMRQVVERVFAQDLELLGYRFGEPAPMNYLELTPHSGAAHPNRTSTSRAA